MCFYFTVTNGTISSAVTCSRVLLQYLVSRVGCPPIAVSIPSNLTNTPNNAHVSSSPSVSTPSQSTSLSPAAKTTSILSPSTTCNILASLSPQNVASPTIQLSQPAETSSSEQQSQNENRNAAHASILTPASNSVSTTAATASPTVTLSTPPPKEEKGKSVVVTDKHLVIAIKALCQGHSALCKTEHASLSSAVRAAKVPTCIKINTLDKDSSSSSSSIKDSSRRNRCDPSAAIMEQLISPMHELTMVKNIRLESSEQISLHSADKEEGAPEPVTERSSDGGTIRNLFGKRCESALQAVGGGAILLDVCLRLPSINKYNLKYKELLEGKGFNFPSTFADVQNFKGGLSQLVSELGIVSRILHLPIIEPLNVQRLQKLATLAMAGLLASLHVAVSSAISAVPTTTLQTTTNVPGTTTSGANTSAKQGSARDEELDSLSCSITEKSLHIYSIIINAVSQSSRAGGHHYQNLQLMGAWLLASGLHQMMLLVSTIQSSASTGVTSSVLPDKLKEDKGKSPTKKDSQTRINLSKVQAGFSPVAIALSTQCCTLLKSLLDDAIVEGWTPNKPVPSPAKLNILESFNATDRLARIFSAVPLNQLLFYLATVSYRKVSDILCVYT